MILNVCRRSFWNCYNLEKSMFFEHLFCPTVGYIEWRHLAAFRSAFGTTCSWSSFPHRRNQIFLACRAKTPVFFLSDIWHDFFQPEPQDPVNSLELFQNNPLAREWQPLEIHLFLFFLSGSDFSGWKNVRYVQGFYNARYEMTRFPF